MIGGLCHVFFCDICVSYKVLGVWIVFYSTEGNLSE